MMHGDGRVANERIERIVACNTGTGQRFALDEARKRGSNGRPTDTVDRHGERVQRFAADQLPVLRKQLESARRLARPLLPPRGTC